MPPDRTESKTDITETVLDLYADFWGSRISERDFFAATFQAVYKPLFSYVRHKSGLDDGNVEDIVQESLLRFAKLIQTLPDTKNVNKADEFENRTFAVWPWFKRVAGNVTNDHFRKAKKSGISLDENPQFDIGVQPASENLETEIITLIQEAVKDLPWKCRYAIDMCVLGDKTQTELAKELSVKRSTIEHYIALAKRRLQANPRLVELAKKRYQHDR